MSKSTHGGMIIGSVMAIGITLLIMVALIPVPAATVTGDPASVNPDPPADMYPPENTTLYSTNLVVEVEAALYNNASFVTPGVGWTNVQSTMNYTAIMLPDSPRNESWGQCVAYKILASNATLARILGQPLTCANGSNVIVKLLHAPTSVYGDNPHGIGFIFHANATWWARGFSYLAPTLDETYWLATLAILISIAN